MNLDFAKQKIKHSFYFRTQAARHKCHAAYRATMPQASAFFSLAHPERNTCRAFFFAKIFL